MHPYEWGILGIKALDFYPLFDCAAAHIAPAVVAAFLALQQEQLPQLSHRTWVAIAQKLALLLTSPRRQTFNRPSSAIASQGIIYTNKLN